MAFNTEEHGHSWDVTKDCDEEGMENEFLLLHCVPRLNPNRKLQHLLSGRVQKRVHVLGFVWAWNLTKTYCIIVMKVFGWGKVVVINEEGPAGCLLFAERANTISSKSKCNILRVFKVFVAELVSINRHLLLQQTTVVRAIKNIGLATTALLFGLLVTVSPILHGFVQFVIEEKGKEPRDEGDVPEDLLRSLSIRMVMAIFALRACSELCVWPSKCNTGLDTAVVVNRRHFGKFVNELLHVV